jgi:hypothetical protein
MQIKVGTLVMWTTQHHILDKGSVGLVTFVFGMVGFRQEEGIVFKVLWSNGDVLQHNSEGMAVRRGMLKVVRF